MSAKKETNGGWPFSLAMILFFAAVCLVILDKGESATAVALLMFAMLKVVEHDEKVDEESDTKEKKP